MIAAIVAILVLAGCTVTTYGERPSIRTFPLGDGRRYVDGEHRYRSEVTLRKAGQAPAVVDGVATTLRVDLLRVDLLEPLVASEGKALRVSVTVTAAEAVGDDAAGERQAALGRSLSITPYKEFWEIRFAGGGLGIEGRVRAIDLILLGHLMAPSSSVVDPSIGQRIPELASIRSGWSSNRLEITGESTLTEQGRARGRAVSRYDGRLKANASVSTELGIAAVPEVLVTTSGSDPLICLFTLGLVCQVPASTFRASPTVDISGPLTITDQATIHRNTGRLLRVSGEGRADLAGMLPAAGDVRGRPDREQALFLSARPLALELRWTFSEELADPWPRDPIPRALLVTAGGALGTVLVLLVVAGGIFLRRWRWRWP